MTPPVAVRDAATTVVMRDARDGLEVLLLRRHAGHVFGPGAYVFPGGAVDPSDAEPRLQARCGPGELAGDGLAAFRMAAIRECFEEAGLLVATAGSKTPTDAIDGMRGALNTGRRGWLDVVECLDLRFDLAALIFVACWTTPPGAPRRYATRFFATVAAGDREARCDGTETVSTWWTTPARALEACRAGEIGLMRPTEATLGSLRGMADAPTAIAALATADRGGR